MLTEQEKNIAKELKQQGFSTQQILGHIGGMRNNAPSTFVSTQLQKEGKQSFLQDAMQDIKTAGSNIIGTTKKELGSVASRITAPRRRDISAVEDIGRRVVGTGADVFRGASRVAGEIVGGAMATVAPQGVEDVAQGVVGGAVQTVANTPVAQALLQRYQSLTPDVKEQVDNILGFTEGLAALGGAGAAKSGAQAGVQVAKSGIKRGAEMAKNTKINTGMDTVTDAFEKVRTVVDNKYRNVIENDVDELLKQTRGIQGKVQLMKDRNTDVAPILKDISVFKGLKVEGGKIDPTEAVKTVQDRIDVLMDAKRETLPTVSRYVPDVTRDEVRAYAKRKARGTVPDADENALMARIDKQVDALPEKMSLTELDEKRALFRKSARDARGLQKQGDHYSTLENATRDIVFDRIETLPQGIGEQYVALNDYIKQLINTSEFLDKTVRGQIVKGGRLGRFGAQVVGAVAGGSGGNVFTAIIGARLAEAVQSILLNNQLGSSIKMRLIRNITDNNPEAVRMAEQLLKDVRDYQQPLLPAPREGAPRSVVYGTETIPVAPQGSTILYPNKKVQVGGDAPTNTPQQGTPSEPYRPYDLYEKEGVIDFGKPAKSKFKKQQKDLPVIR